MSSAWRRFALLAHVLVSVAFPGAVACFLVLAALGPRDAAVYGAMELITWYAIVPLCLLSLLTGIVSSIGTPWGLVRYYWVVVKLSLTIPSTLILLVHLGPIHAMASGAGTPGIQKQLLTAAALALAVLVVLTWLSIYKPRGLTPWGVRSAAR